MQRKFSNNAEGFDELGRLLQKLAIEKARVCMESTGRYWEAVAIHLHKGGHLVSVVPPARIKGYGQGEFKRTKTDKADAAMIARFCEKHSPPVWTPPEPEEADLKELERHLFCIKRMLVEEENRLEAGAIATSVVTAINQHLEFLDTQKREMEAAIRKLIKETAHLAAAKKLIVSINGIGETTAAVFLGEVGSIAKFQHVRQLDAFAGLDVTERLSGTSIHGKPHISKAGSKRLRTALYLPALSAMRCNPLIKRFVERLQQRRLLPKKVIICAVMRKLLHLIYGVLKTGNPFDPQHGMPSLAL